MKKRKGLLYKYKGLSIYAGFAKMDLQQVCQQIVKVK